MKVTQLAIPYNTAWITMIPCDTLSLSIPRSLSPSLSCVGGSYKSHYKHMCNWVTRSLYSVYSLRLHLFPSLPLLLFAPSSLLLHLLQVLSHTRLSTHK